MARTESTMMPLGTAAPSFDLPDVVSGSRVGLETFSGKKALLLMFICRHCPYVKHVQSALAQLAADYGDQGVGIVAISSNDAAAYPEDAPHSLREQALELQFSFPYCFDESQEVARAYGAVCTPDFFIFDESRKLAYRGRLDDSRPRGSDPVTGNELRAALDAVLKGQPVSGTQMPSIGCSIKWKA